MNFTSLNEAWNIETFSTTETDSEVDNKIEENNKTEVDNKIEDNNKTQVDNKEINKIKEDITILKNQIKNLELENKKLKDNNSNNNDNNNNIILNIENFINKNRETIIMVLIIISLYLLFKILNKDKINNLIQSKYFNRPYY